MSNVLKTDKEERAPGISWESRSIRVRARNDQLSTMRRLKLLCQSVSIYRGQVISLNCAHKLIPLEKANAANMMACMTGGAKTRPFSALLSETHRRIDADDRQAELIECEEPKCRRDGFQGQRLLSITSTNTRK